MTFSRESGMSLRLTTRDEDDRYDPVRITAVNPES
jgi:hypothetical protein